MRIRELSPETVIVLGGKHCNETFFSSDAGSVCHLHASPAKLMAQGKIPHVFDLAFSGDGEDFIAEVGEVVARFDGLKQDDVRARLDALFAGTSFCPDRARLKSARGSWTATRLADGQLRNIVSAGLTLDRDALPAPAALFPVKSNFAIFGVDATAHVYSDSGKGCVFSCSFCSEASAINDKPVGIQTAASRLARQIRAVSDVGKQAGGLRMSAFVEDSILLNGHLSSLEKLAGQLEQSQNDVVFGAQLTIDMINHSKRLELIQRLSKCGLKYIFFGLETGDDDIAGRMHKNSESNKSKVSSQTQSSSSGWLDRARRAIANLTATGIEVGVSVLFGLGETQDNRLRLLRQLQAWQETLGGPMVVSLNWAVQHPLRDPKNSFDYLEWGVNVNSERYDVLCEMFGEASEIYPLPGQEMASLAELRAIRAEYDKLRNKVSDHQSGSKRIDRTRTYFDENGLCYFYVDVNNPLYSHALKLRFKEFFEGTGAGARELLDSFEEDSLHLVVTRPDKVTLAAYARLTLHSEGSAQISQLVVAEEHRGRIFGVWHGMFNFMRKSAVEAKCTTIFGNVRMRNVRLFSKAGLVPIGEPFASPKTGIIHRRMEIAAQQKPVPSIEQVLES
jgi:radical SAM superfamily enzyme YgiQ (UPF0313 family)